MELTTVRELAESLIRQMWPFCAQIEVAGSIRREVETVKDVEIVAVPRWEERPGEDLFGTPEPVNVLHEWATGPECGVRWIKTGTSEVVDWAPKADGKYWRGLLPEGIKLDLFLATPDNYGLVKIIRTGSWEFSKALVTHAANVGKPSRDGRLWDGDTPIPTPTELHVFEALNMAWVWPRDRTGAEAVRRLR